jgi:outer membrane cobalamin receptor
MKLDFRQSLLATSIFVSAGLLATPAFAQEPVEGETPAEAQTPEEAAPAIPEAEEAAGQDIVVTGTRIARPNVESASPVTIVGAEDLARQGTTRVEDMLNSLPQVTPGQTAFVSNGATGTATVNLRGLGTARTLVLVNGRRLQPGDPFLPVADLNQIPTSLVKRIEVLTGGASSTYGADAVAGVVNFIMDTDFKGFQLDGTYSFYQHNNHNDQELGNNTNSFVGTIRDRMDQRGFTYPTGNVVDGGIMDLTATIGASFDDGRGNVVAYVGYRETDPVLEAKRDHSSCALAVTGVNAVTNPTGNLTCGGSSTTPDATIASYYFNAFFGAAPGSWTGRPSAYNYAPINYFQRADKRWTAGAFANYEISPAVQPYAEFMFMDDRSKGQIAQSGTFFADVINMRCDSPLLTAAQQAQLCSWDGNAALGDPVADGVVPILVGKRNVEGGGRIADLRHTAYRAVLGSKGDITDKFSYDISGIYGTTIFSQTYRNDFSRSRLRNALQAVDDGSGNIVCAINADADPNNNDAGCVPYNPFQGIGIVNDVTQGITQGALNYVSIPGLQNGNTTNYGVTGTVSGELFNLMSAEPVTALIGVEYLARKLDLQSDSTFESGDLAGQGGPSPSVEGKYHSNEVFAEVLAPIVTDRPYMERLQLELGYRYSDYNLGFSTDTYKVMAEYSPIREIKIRGGYNRAVRAPNILELFTPNSLGLWSGSDPCAGVTPEFTLAQCANTGVTAAQYGTIQASPADQYNQVTGGNLDLSPEKADTWTVGVVLEPRDWLPGFVATIDYFNIKVEDAIGGIGAETILRQCGLTGAAQFCNLVNRRAGSGDLWVGSDPATAGYIENTTQNIGGLSTEGMDFGVSYARQIWDGKANFDLVGTWLFDSKFDTGIPGVDPATGEATDGVYDCVGFHGSICGFPTPKWRHTFRAGYTFSNGIGLSMRWRFIGKVDLDQFSDDPDLSTDTSPDERGNIGSRSYFDLTASANLTEKFRLLLGVNNIMDKDPPLIPAAYGTDNANTWAGTYDPVGRTIFLKGTLRY